MIVLKVRIKADNRSYVHTEFLSDEYIISKQNNDLSNLVDKVCKESHIEDIQDVIVTAKFEW